MGRPRWMAGQGAEQSGGHGKRANKVQGTVRGRAKARGGGHSRAEGRTGRDGIGVLAGQGRAEQSRAEQNRTEQNRTG